MEDTQRLPKKNLNYKSEGKRSIGRPQTRWEHDFRDEELLTICVSMSFFQIVSVMSSVEVCAIRWSRVRAGPSFVSLFIYVDHRNFFQYRALTCQSLAIEEVKGKKERERESERERERNSTVQNIKHFFYTKNMEAQTVHKEHFNPFCC